MVVKGFRIDLTEVVTDRVGQQSEVTYEVEIELLEPQGLNLNTLNSVVINTIKELQGTLIIYTMEERYQVISDFNRNTGSSWDGARIDHTTLDQVRNIKIRDMVAGGLMPGKGPKVMRYGADIKADGSKKYLFIHSAGLFLIQAPGEVMKVGSSSSMVQLKDYYGTIIQGELIPKESLTENAIPEIRNAAIYMLLYDCLSMSGTSVRHLSFDQRQVYVDAVLRVFTQTESIVLQKKTFKPWTTPNEFYQAISTILDGQYPFKTDGIIIQPLDHIYDSSVQLIPLSQRRLNLRPDLLKWKPPQLLTIDLELQKTQKSEPGPNGPVTNTIKYELLMNRRGQTQRIPFRGSTIYPFDPQRDIVINKYMEYPNGTILEFRWNSDLKKLEPIKDRDEKPTPNNDDIALNVWEDIHQPIDQDVITGRKWSLMFRYHNREKSEIYKIVSGGAVVSMGTGAGGDIFKWQRANVTHVLCIEPNQENRVELQQRLQAVNTIQYRIVSTVGQDYPLILQNLTEFYGKQVDILEYMLSLSFFFDNDQSLVSILQAGQLVRPGGHLLAFTIDGRRVALFPKPSQQRHH